MPSNGLHAHNIPTSNISISKRIGQAFKDMEYTVTYILYVYPLVDGEDFVAVLQPGHVGQPLQIDGDGTGKKVHSLKYQTVKLL